MTRPEYSHTNNNGGEAPGGETRPPSFLVVVDYDEEEEDGLDFFFFFILELSKRREKMVESLSLPTTLFSHDFSSRPLPLLSSAQGSGCKTGSSKVKHLFRV